MWHLKAQQGLEESLGGVLRDTMGIKKIIIQSPIPGPGGREYSDMPRRFPSVHTTISL